MKSPDALLFPVLIAVMLAATLAGCGQTGPLYMPQPPARPAAMTPAPAVPVQPPPTVPAAQSNDLPPPVPAQ